MRLKLLMNHVSDQRRVLQCYAICSRTLDEHPVGYAKEISIVAHAYARVNLIGEHILNNLIPHRCVTRLEARRKGRSSPGSAIASRCQKIKDTSTVAYQHPLEHFDSVQSRRSA
eukprot:scaffold127893_cov62-Attheya_sp.AAC.3